MSHSRSLDGVKVPAEWADDCQGKKDFDGELVSLSTRYWPAGGGVYMHSPTTGWVQNPFPDIKPSATSKIILRHSDGYVIFAEESFEADNLEEVKTKVEVWAQEQYRRVIAALTLEFGECTQP